MFFLVRGYTTLYPPDAWKRKDRNDHGNFGIPVSKAGMLDFNWLEITSWAGRTNGR